MKIEISEHDLEILVAAVRSLVFDAEDAADNYDGDPDEGVVLPPWEWAEYDYFTKKMRYGGSREYTMEVEEFLHLALNKASEVL